VRGPRALVLSLILLIVMTVYSLYTNGYGVLTGSHDETIADSKMTIRRCSYWTGRETVITHIMRATTDPRGKASCQLVTKVYLDQQQMRQMQPTQSSQPTIEIKPEQPAPSTSPAPAAPTQPAAPPASSTPPAEPAPPKTP
jgi:hypothetical protein